MWSETYTKSSLHALNGNYTVMYPENKTETGALKFFNKLDGSASSLCEGYTFVQWYM